MRVQFLFTFRTYDDAENPHRSHFAQSRHKRAAARILTETIPLRPADRDRIESGMSCRIDCSGDQFARFLIARNNAGLQNQFKELEPKIIEDRRPERVEYPLFVSMRDEP